MTGPPPARVLVTRPAGSWPSLVSRYAGTIAIELAPTAVQVEPLDPAPGERALDALAGYDWLVATSGQGVKALTLRLAARDRRSLPSGLKVAAVGERTAEALRGTGVTVDVVAADPRAAGLVEALRPRLGEGARVLVVKPEGGPALLAAALRGAGARVDEAPLYRTIASDMARPLAERAIAGAFAAVAFTAPSSLTLWLEAAAEKKQALVEALSRVKRVAIGATTAAALEDAHLPAHAVAARPDEDATGEAIGRALAASTC
ncbi:MAG TPA: uroporphyrinogen-III synthase [Candidatus Polarisedimenticolaceae bacterium]|nr:uroporphyrinogen-III synthase [Candidatus Polarisedimenticolaceae bacterium]